jgi:PAS domain S-box-containing protein
MINLALLHDPRSGDSFRSIVEHSTDLVTRVDRDGRHLYSNPAVERLLGRPAGDIIGRSYREIPGMEPVADVLEPRLAKIFEDGHEAEVEVEVPTLEGTSRWFHTRLIPEWDAYGNVDTVLLDGRDITERKRTERQLLESEERFRFLIEGSRQVFFYIHDQDHRFVYLSPTVEGVLGYTAMELVGKPYDILLVEKTAEKVHRETVASFGRTDGTAPSLYLARVRRRDGEEIILELVERRVSRNGLEPLIQGFARDVTRRERAAEMNHFLSRASRVLASSIDYSRTLRSVARFAVPTMADWCVVDVVEEASGKVSRLAARHSVAAMQATASALLAYPPDMSLEKGVPEVLRTGRTLRINRVDMAQLTDGVHDDVHRATLEHLGISSVMIVPLRCRRRTIGALTFVTSHSARQYTLDDQRAAERLADRAAIAIENARLHREAQEAIWAREEILAFVSHDLKNPLSVVINAAALLEERADDPAAIRKYCSLIPKAAGQMHQLVNDLLTASRMEAGRFWIDAVPSDPQQLVEDAMELLDPLADSRGITLGYHVQDDLPAVAADPRRVLQVLENLVGNALDLTEEGGEVRLEARLADGHVHFAVFDDGPGIAEADRPRLFEQFYQGAAVKKKGWGLGLAITRGIVEAHGGEIRVDSVEGGGSTFTFTLPVA